MVEEEREIIIVIDGLAGQFSFENAQILYLAANEGYYDLARKLQNKSLSVSGFKIIILLIGRGEVWDTDHRYFKGVEEAVKEVKNQNEKAIIVLGATLPSTADSRPMVNSFTFRNDKLASRCTQDERLEHARPGKHLLGSRGPVEAYYDSDGNINELGGMSSPELWNEKFLVLSYYSSVGKCSLFRSITPEPWQCLAVSLFV